LVGLEVVVYFVCYGGGCCFYYFVCGWGWVGDCGVCVVFYYVPLFVGVVGLA